MERVLVCILAGTRASRLTFASFKKHCLDELNADLGLAILIGEKFDYTNPMWQHAKYRWTAPVCSDYGLAFDFVQRWLCQQLNVPAPDWRPALKTKGIWQGGLQSEDSQPSASSILPFCRWLLLNGLQQDQIIGRYDRFVITRSDFVWLCPHPPMSILDRDAIWLPDGEDYGGLNDRHMVVSRVELINCLNVIEEVLLHPIQFCEAMQKQPDYGLRNDELVLAHHFERTGLLNRVKRFPYVMYTAREVNDESPTWSPGHYEPSVGHYVKYEKEFRSACAYATIIRSRADWENGRWRQIDPTLVSTRAAPLFRHFCYNCQSMYYSIKSALKRPRRIKRFLNYVKYLTRRS